MRDCSSFLIGRQQFVKNSNKSSNNVLNQFSSLYLAVTVGMPQDSILGPILFLISISDIFDLINYSFLVYVDNTLAVVTGNNPING